MILLLTKLFISGLDEGNFSIILVFPFASCCCKQITTSYLSMRVVTSDFNFVST